MELNQVTLPVTDVKRSVAFYERLGFTQIVGSSHYARFECRPGGPTFSLQAVDSVHEESGVIVYFECEDLDGRCAELRELGVELESAPHDTSWLWREAYLRDPDNNRICLYHAGENRLNPPWRIV